MIFALVALTVALHANEALAFPAPAVAPVQSNATNHGDSNISCTPTSWTDIASFFIGNYVAHAATVKSYPGEGGKSMILAMLGALLLPTSGLIRGFNGILRNAKFRDSKGFKGFFQAALSTPNYNTAAAAGALTMLVRTPSWRPEAGDVIAGVIPRNACELRPGKNSNARITRTVNPPSFPPTRAFKVDIGSDPELDTPRVLKIYRPPWVRERSSFWTFSDTASAFVDSKRTIHGSYDLKTWEGQYALAYVPRDASVVRKSSSPTAQDPVIGASYSFPTALIAVLQLIFAIVTLYETTRGAQINTYGYAAFGLTVVPYAMMSLVNLISALTTPAYSTLLMVGSEVMDEAERRGATFDGVVGKLAPDDTVETINATVENTPDVVTEIPPVVPAPTNEKQSADTEVKDSVRTLENNNQNAMSFTCRGPDSQVITYSVIEGPENPSRDDVRDISPSLFVPSCSPFQRSIPGSNTVDPGITSYGAGGYHFKSEGIDNVVLLIHPSKIVVSLINGAIILAIIGGLSRFRRESSTYSQRAWLVTWYVFGFYIGGIISDAIDLGMAMNVEQQQRQMKGIQTITSIMAILMYGVPSIGGFVVVAQMLWNYGTCTVKG